MDLKKTHNGSEEDPPPVGFITQLIFIIQILSWCSINYWNSRDLLIFCTDKMLIKIL